MNLFSIGIGHYVILSALLFTIGLVGIFLNRRNILLLLLALEILLLAINLNFVAFSAFLQDFSGQIYTFFILTVAAAEAAIGLALLIVFFRNTGSISIHTMEKLKG